MIFKNFFFQAILIRSIIQVCTVTPLNKWATPLEGTHLEAKEVRPMEATPIGMDMATLGVLGNPVGIMNYPTILSTIQQTWKCPRMETCPKLEIVSIP